MIQPGDNDQGDHSHQPVLSGAVLRTPHASRHIVDSRRIQGQSDGKYHRACDQRRGHTPYDHSTTCCKARGNTWPGDGFPCRSKSSADVVSFAPLFIFGFSLPWQPPLGPPSDRHCWQMWILFLRLLVFNKGDRYLPIGKFSSCIMTVPFSVCFCTPHAISTNTVPIDLIYHIFWLNPSIFNNFLL